MNDGLLLDTHAAIWWLDGSRISKAARDAVDAASMRNRVKVSPITAWEVALAVARKRLTIHAPPKVWYRTLVGLPGFAEVDLSADTVIESEALPDGVHRDPADRFLIATARVEGLTLVTRDRRILAYGKAGHVLTLEC